MGILTFSFKDYRHAKEFARTGQLNYRYIDIAWKMSKSQFGFRAIRGGFQFHQYCLVNGDENRCSLFYQYNTGNNRLAAQGMYRFALVSFISRSQ